MDASGATTAVFARRAIFLAALALALTAAGALALIRAAPPVSAATPTATRTAMPTRTATPVPVPTPRPLFGSEVRVHLINDLNGDGLIQNSEPGLPGWQFSVGCEDDLLSETTDANGETAVSPPTCMRFEPLPAGWLVTSPPTRRIVVAADAKEVFILVHDFGADTMSVGVSLSVDGLPAKSPVLTLAPPIEGCLRYTVDRATLYESAATMVILASSAKAGCPAEGEAVNVLISGRPAQPALSFARGGWTFTPLTVGGPSMLFYTYKGMDGATIDGVECGIVVHAGLNGGPWEHTPEEDNASVYVVSEQTRPGCGAPGKLVEFRRNGVGLRPLIPWGTEYMEDPGLRPTSPVQRITPPNTGGGGALAATGGAEGPLRASLALAAAGASALLAAIFLLRRFARPRP